MAEATKLIPATRLGAYGSVARRLKMPRRNAHGDAAPSENEALNDGQTQELQVNSVVNGSSFSMIGENELVHSSNASQYFGERIPTNTMYNTGTGIKAFARFVVGASIEQEFEAVPSLKDSLKEAEYEVEKLKQLLFSGCVPEEPVSEEPLELIRFHLVEFVTRYEKAKGGEATPVTVLNYINAIQIQFKYWGYEMDLQKHPIIKKLRNGLLHVMDYRFSEQQSRGLLLLARGTLTKSEFIKRITSKACDPANPIGYQTRLIVSVAACLGVRLGALAALTMNQFTHSTSKDSNEIVFTLNGIHVVVIQRTK